MTLTLSRRWGVKKGQKYGLDKVRKYVYKIVNKELMGSSSGRNSVVECQLPKLDVGGSNPLARFFSPFVSCCQRVLTYCYNVIWVGCPELVPAKEG